MLKANLYGTVLTLLLFSILALGFDVCSHARLRVTESVSMRIFAGLWLNVNENTCQIIRIEIEEIGENHLSIHPWAMCDSTDCDWGARTFNVDSNPFTITWDVWFLIKTLTFTYQENGRLHVHTFTHFTDDSGRPDYHYDDYFEKSISERILSSKAAELAKEVIGKGYGYTSGSEDVAGYTKVGENYRFLSSDEISSLVCCGLIFWSYNKAYYDSIGHTLITQEEFENRPVNSGEHASWQWKFNVNPTHMWKNVEKMNEIEVEEVIRTIEEDVRIGDLIFFDTDENGLMDHVVMFTEIREDEFYIIHAHDGEEEQAGISENTIDNLTKTYYWCAKNGIYPFKGLSIGVGQVIDYFELKIVGGSPIDLVIVDPDGDVISKDVGKTFDIEYWEFDIDGDGKLNDIVTFRTRKKGNYLIQVVPEPEASPTDTYTLKVEALMDDELTTVVLAEGVCIRDIKSEPDQVCSTETGITYWTDLNEDGTVNIMDIALVAKAYGTKEGDSNWNPIADVVEPYGEINILDIAMVAKDYGKTV